MVSTAYLEILDNGHLFLRARFRFRSISVERITKKLFLVSKRNGNRLAATRVRVALEGVLMTAFLELQGLSARPCWRKGYKQAVGAAIGQG